MVTSPLRTSPQTYGYCCFCFCFCLRWILPFFPLHLFIYLSWTLTSFYENYLWKNLARSERDRERRGEPRYICICRSCFSVFGFGFSAISFLLSVFGFAYAICLLAIMESILAQAISNTATQQHSNTATKQHCNRTAEQPEQPEIVAASTHMLIIRHVVGCHLALRAQNCKYFRQLNIIKYLRHKHTRRPPGEPLWAGEWGEKGS